MDPDLAADELLLSDDDLLRRGLVRAARRHDAAEWRDRSLIYADYLDEHGQSERAGRRRLNACAKRSCGCRWPRAAGLSPDLSDHQRAMLRLALRGPVGLLTGTPGTGKTFCVAALLERLFDQYGTGAVAVAAPTGKAAVRCTATLRKRLDDVDFQATTIHQLLEIGRNGHDGDGWGFLRNRDNPLRQRFVVIDEASMLDTDLAASLFDACEPGTHVLLVGDPYQLPPVGHGAPFRDMIAAGLPNGELSEIRRNAGLIVRACAQIRRGEDFETCDRFDPSAGLNLRHVEAATPADQLTALKGVLARISQSKRFDPVWDTQVLVATNARGDLSRNAVNRVLQAELNRDALVCPPNPFGVGDKVICLRNHFATAGQDGDPVRPDGFSHYLANGEIGKVVALAPKVAAAEFPGHRVVRFPVARVKDESKRDEQAETETDFDLAYGITCHKSQGSEWPVVVVLVDGSGGAVRVCDRNWLYTAVSRASELCVTIGRASVMQQMARRCGLVRRKTFLEKLLTSEV